MIRQEKIKAMLIFVIVLSFSCVHGAFSQSRKLPPVVSIYCMLESVLDGNRLEVYLVAPSSKSEKWTISEPGLKSFATSIEEKGVYTCRVAVFDARDSLFNYLERKFYASCEEKRVVISASYSQKGYRMHDCNDASPHDCLYSQSDEGKLFITKYYTEALAGKYSEDDAKVRGSEISTFPNDWKTEVLSRYDYGRPPKKKDIEPATDYFRFL